VLPKEAPLNNLLYDNTEDSSQTTSSRSKGELGTTELDPKYAGPVETTSGGAQNQGLDSRSPTERQR
jgi:hypothetical protein